jgi:hypothetical protein
MSEIWPLMMQKEIIGRIKGLVFSDLRYVLVPQIGNNLLKQGSCRFDL